MRKVFHWFFFSTATLCLMFSGCGYTTHTTLPRDIHTIYVDTVKNKIPIQEVYLYVPGLEMEITQAVIRRLQDDGNLRVVPREEADAVLEMTLTEFEQEGLRFTSLESVEEYRMFIVLDMKLMRPTQKRDDDGNMIYEQIWREGNFSGDAEYFVSDVRSVSRDAAAREAVKKIARNIVDRIVEDW